MLGLNETTDQLTMVHSVCLLVWSCIGEGWSCDEKSLEL